MRDEQNQPGAVGTLPGTVDPERARELLASINRVQLEFIADAPLQQVFATLLESLLALTESEYGFIGQVLRLEDGTPFLKTHAISDIAWNEETRRLYQEKAPNLEFDNLDTLFGRVMVTGKPIIADDPANDERAGGLPPGHPPLRSFLGIPFQSAGQMVGMVGIANRPGGYDETLIRFLEPFLSTCAHIIVASETATRRRLAESAMHRQALVFENLYDGVILTDWEGRITDWNPGAERMYGYRREEVLGELPELFYKPPQGAVNTKDILDCVEREGRWTGESLFVHKDGRTGFSETVVVALRDERGRPVGTVGVNRDVTDRKRAETVLRRQALVFENLYDGVILCNWDGRITDWNAGAERMFGYTCEEVLGETPEILDLPERAASLTREILEAIKQKGRWSGENVFVRKDGSTGVSEMVIVPLYDEHNRPIGTVGVNRDITERKLSEEALRQSEERFRLVTQATRDAIYDWDIRTNDVWRNEAYIRQYGPDSSHAVGGESGWWIGCIHPDDRDGVLTGIRNSLESDGDRWTADYRMRTTDGSYATVIDMSFIMRDHRGEPIRMIGAMMDITDRKKAEDALRFSRQTLESTLDSLSAHIALLDDTGTIVSVNAAWRRFARASGFRLPDYGVGANYLEACCENEQVRSEIEKLIRGHASESNGAVPERFEYEYCCRMPSGQEWFVMRATRFEGVGRARVVVSHENITDRKRSQEALGESEERFRQIAEHIREVFWLTENDGKTVVYVSPAYEEIWGRTIESLHESPTDWMEAIHPDDRARMESVFFDAPLETAYDETYRITRPDGSVRWIRDRGFPVRDQEGCVYRVAGLAEDMTESKKSEDALRAARDELEQRVLERTDHLRTANESLQQVIRERTEMGARANQHQAELAHVARISTMGEMAAGLAHELNQPLASISNYADSCVIDVQRNQINPADLLDCLNRISEEALRAGQIIRRIRSFVRKAPPRRSSIDLNELVGEIVKFLEPDARKLEIRMHVELADGVPTIQADPIQIEQVVLNLLRNGMESIKSTDPCDRELRIQTSLIDNAIEFSVHDSGRGVPADVGETIFNPFVTTKADGLGLGLSISRSIIEAHGGRLWADLDEPRGATFRFRIPLVFGGEGARV